MFKCTLLFVLSLNMACAGLLDFWYARNAKEAYEKGEFEKAASLYEKLEPTNDAVAYDVGNSYYRQKAYEKAIEAYAKVKEPTLMPQALHNSGNAYAMLHQNAKAIEAYEAALKLKEDEDTRFNLELLKKEQPQKPSPDDANEPQPSSDDNRTQENTQPPQQSSQQQQTSSKQSEQANNEEQTKEALNDTKASSEDKNDEKQDEMKDNKAQAAMMQSPISEQEERQWDKKLKQRGINTLMLPLGEKGERDATTKPW